MSRAEVDETLGIGTIVDYKRVQLANPWKSEAFVIEDGTPTVILYYVTDGLVWKRSDDRRNLTPVVLESGSVVGWGWSFLERNLDRYHTQTRTIP